MLLIKKIIRNTILYLNVIKKFSVARLYKGKKFFIFVTPAHNNIGDLAILQAEEQFIKMNFPEYKIFEFTGKDQEIIANRINAIVNEDDIVTIHGGGFIGTLWINEEEYMRKIVTQLKHCRISIFPQTIYYENSNYGIEQRKITREIYEKCPQLNIFVRERFSYQLAKELFPNTKSYLTPDMVLALKYFNNEKANINNNVLLCLRNDLEKTCDYGNEIKECLSYYDYDVCETDMYCLSKKYLYDRDGVICDKLNEFSSAKLVITDRLHGMVFSALAQTPCVVLLSRSHKVQGVFEWISHLEYIKLITCIDDLGMAINMVMRVKAPTFIFDENNNFYLEMAEIMKDSFNE